jgi:hypothetical protein
MGGGDGHASTGTCQIANDKAEATLKELLAKLRD